MARRSGRGCGFADALNNGQLRTFAPSGVVAGVYARTDATRGVWKAPAGIEATLNGVQSMTYNLSDQENGVVESAGPELLQDISAVWAVVVGSAHAPGARTR